MKMIWPTTMHSVQMTVTKAQTAVMIAPMILMTTINVAPSLHEKSRRTISTSSLPDQTAHTAIDTLTKQMQDIQLSLCELTAVRSSDNMAVWPSN